VSGASSYTAGPLVAIQALLQTRCGVESSAASPRRARSTGAAA